ncbi:formate dehydrogenase subunit delta [Rhizorhapis sp. SPR117]|uniref:formate dehydrogenase subunit delta n=1 Tax=Rhizorhapis sp. SPR117 TaxID=2912611 RepID=UPI001F3599EC|nr:formate dehydrogenase subunit delta [Rhizorhapis sp. SPR117]
MNSLDHLIYMANQIARNFATLKEAQAIAAVAGHIRDFWDPRMKSMIFAHMDAGGAGLESVTRAALDQLAKENGHIAA